MAIKINVLLKGYLSVMFPFLVPLLLYSVIHKYNIADIYNYSAESVRVFFFKSRETKLIAA